MSWLNTALLAFCAAVCWARENPLDVPYGSISVDGYNVTWSQDNTSVTDRQAYSTSTVTVTWWSTEYHNASVPSSSRLPNSTSTKTESTDSIIQPPQIGIPSVSRTANYSKTECRCGCGCRASAFPPNITVSTRDPESNLSVDQSVRMTPSSLANWTQAWKSSSLMPISTFTSSGIALTASSVVLLCSLLITMEQYV